MYVYIFWRQANALAGHGTKKCLHPEPGSGGNLKIAKRSQFSEGNQRPRLENEANSKPIRTQLRVEIALCRADRPMWR
jgi:hypothetical protein